MEFATPGESCRKPNRPAQAPGPHDPLRKSIPRAKKTSKFPTLRFFLDQLQWYFFNYIIQSNSDCADWYLSNDRNSTDCLYHEGGRQFRILRPSIRNLPPGFHFQRSQNLKKTHPQKTHWMRPRFPGRGVSKKKERARGTSMFFGAQRSQESASGEAERWTLAASPAPPTEDARQPRRAKN